MKIYYKIQIDLFKTPHLRIDAEEFAEHFSIFRIKETWFFLFKQKKDIINACHYLKRIKLQWQLSYQIRIHKDEIGKYPGYFPGIPSNYGIIKDNVVNEGSMKKRQILKDLDTEHIIVTKSLRDILTNFNNKFVFEEILGREGNIFYKWIINTTVEEPVSVSKISQLNIISKSDEIFFVVSDGRYFVSENTARSIFENDIAFYNKISHSNKLYKIPNQIIVSPKLLELLYDNRIKGFNEKEISGVVLSENSNRKISLCMI
ncbi:hypothetical protein [Spirochaeta cellobiosiphila]|uniref:hypothetical protein n=1 Tax=Spirochaeta cellobiosiphila TaxID=504483 RepID=UPI000411A6C1|nr:hypothetical protein [Spirochaeta cellobiosiphila]